jgi:hypothetical protein
MEQFSENVSSTLKMNCNFGNDKNNNNQICSALQVVVISEEMRSLIKRNELTYQ